MKKIILLLIFILLLFIGCTSNNINSSNKNTTDSSTNPNGNKNLPVNNQKYSFGPMADLSKIDGETKQQLQDLLNKLGDVEDDQITFHIIDAAFQEDGALILDLFIRNGYPYSIANISCDLQVLEQEDIIASANFELIESEFGVLPAKSSRPWSILFLPEDIVTKEVKSKNYTIKALDILFEHIEES